MIAVEGLSFHGSREMEPRERLPGRCERRRGQKARDTRKSSPANFQASNEKQLGRHALRFRRFADAVAEIERIQA